MKVLLSIIFLLPLVSACTYVQVSVDSLPIEIYYYADNVVCIGE